MSEPTIGNVTWSTLYDAASGNLPTHASYGFTKTGTFDTESVSGGWLRLTKTQSGGFVGKAYYSKSSLFPSITSGRVLVLHVRARLETTHTYSTCLRYGWPGLTSGSHDYDELRLQGSWSGWGTNKWGLGGYGGILVPQDTFTGGVAFDLFHVWRLSGTAIGFGKHEVWTRDVGSYGINSGAGLTLSGRNGGYTSANLNQLIWGDYYDGYGQDWSVSLIRAGVSSTSQILSTNGLPLFETPSTEPAVAITIDDRTLTAGQAANLTATLAGGAAATLDGVALTSGVAVEAVTASAGSLIGPTADVPVIGQMPTRDRPAIVYTGGAMRIYYATTQPTTYTVQRRAYPAGTTWATDTTQPASGVITVSALTYNGSTPGTSYATNHGLTLSGSYEYRLLPTYSDGSIGQPSNPIVPNDAADYEIAVSGDVPAEWYSVTTVYVRAELSHLVTIGGREYPRGGAERYRGAIQSDGTWSISGLPRLASAARGDGGAAGELRATFLFPDGSRVEKILPNQASASFASLTAYT